MLPEPKEPFPSFDAERLDLVLELRVVAGHQLAVHVAEVELEDLVGITRHRMGQEVVRLGQPLGLGDILAIGD